MTPGMYLAHVVLSAVAVMSSLFAAYQLGIRRRYLSALYYAILSGGSLAYLIQLNFPSA
jgi:hypothetical protein